MSHHSRAPLVNSLAVQLGQGGPHLLVEHLLSHRGVRHEVHRLNWAAAQLVRLQLLVQPGPYLADWLTG